MDCRRMQESRRQEIDRDRGKRERDKNEQLTERERENAEENETMDEGRGDQKPSRTVSSSYSCSMSLIT